MNQFSNLFPLLEQPALSRPVPFKRPTPLRCRVGLHAFNAEEIAPTMEVELCWRCGRERIQAVSTSLAGRTDRALADHLLMARAHS